MFSETLVFFGKNQKIIKKTAKPIFKVESVHGVDRLVASIAGSLSGCEYRGDPASGDHYCANHFARSAIPDINLIAFSSALQGDSL